jgi:hypothetical protein
MLGLTIKVLVILSSLIPQASDVLVLEELYGIASIIIEAISSSAMTQLDPIISHLVTTIARRSLSTSTIEQNLPSSISSANNRIMELMISHHLQPALDFMSLTARTLSENWLLSIW